MIVRELLTLLGWDVDESGANQYDRRTEQSQQRTERATTAMGRAWERLGSGIDRGLAKADRSLEKVQNGLQGAANSLGGLAGALGGGLGLAALGEMTSRMTDFQSRLSNAVEGTGTTVDDLRNLLLKSANDTRQSMDTVTDAFLNIRPALSEMGVDTEGQVKLLTSMSDAMRLGGTSAEKSQAAFMWLSRTLATGKMSGEAFVGIMENADDVLFGMQKHLGMTTEEFQQMGRSGKFTARQMVQYFDEVAESNRKAAAAMPTTIAGAFTVLRNSFEDYIFGVDDATKASSKFAKVVMWFAERPAILATAALGAIGAGLLAMGLQAAATAVTFVRGLISMVAWMRALTAAQIKAAATNPFVWVAAAIVGMQDLLRWVRGDVSQIGRLIGTLAELEATPAANRKWWQNWALGVADYTKNVDAAGAATQTLFTNASNPPPDQSWSAWFKQLGADADKALFGAGGWADWSPITINEGGKAAKAIDWLKGKFDQLATEAGAAWETLSAKLSSEIGGAVANVQASWSSMVDGAKSAFGTAVDFMIAKWGELKAAVLDNAVVRGVKDLANKAAGALGFDAPFVENGGGTPIVQPDGKRAGGGPVNRGGLYLVGEEGPELVQMGGSGFVTPAPQTRTVLDSWLDRTGGLGGRMAAGVAAAGVALSPVAAAASTPQAAQQAAWMAPAGRGWVVVNVGSAPTTVNIERGAIPDGVSVEQVVELIDSRAGAAAEKTLRRAIDGAVRHFTEQEE